MLGPKTKLLAAQRDRALQRIARAGYSLADLILNRHQDRAHAHAQLLAALQVQPHVTTTGITHTHWHHAHPLASRTPTGSTHTHWHHSHRATLCCRLRSAQQTKSPPFHRAPSRWLTPPPPPPPPLSLSTLTWIGPSLLSSARPLPTVASCKCAIVSTSAPTRNFTSAPRHNCHFTFTITLPRTLGEQQSHSLP